MGKPTVLTHANSLQALADAEETVIAEVVGFLSQLCKAGHIRKRALLPAARKVDIQHSSVNPDLTVHLAVWLWCMVMLCFGMA